MMKKNRINLPRRQFLAGSATGLSAAAVGGVGLGFSQRAKAGVNAQTSLLVYIFLRGGMDGLSFMIPTSGADQTHYFNARQATYVDPSQPLDLFGSGFGLHPFWPGPASDQKSNGIYPRLWSPPGCADP